MSTNDVATETDPHTRAGHERFKSSVTFKAVIDGTEVELRWNEWMEWQATRDPLIESPAEAEKVRKRIEEERRGPGIAKRNGAAHPKKASSAP